MPPPYKAELTGGAYMTQGFDRNLQVLSVDAFQILCRQAASLNGADPLARLLLRLILGNAVEFRQPGTSLAIPDNLKEYAQLNEDVLLIGQGDYFEVWAPEQWAEQESQLSDAEANATRFAGLKLATRPMATD